MCKANANLSGDTSGSFSEEEHHCPHSFPAKDPVCYSCSKVFDPCYLPPSDNFHYFLVDGEDYVDPGEIDGLNPSAAVEAGVEWYSNFCKCCKAPVCVDCCAVLAIYDGWVFRICTACILDEVYPLNHARKLIYWSMRTWAKSNYCSFQEQRLEGVGSGEMERCPRTGCERQCLVQYADQYFSKCR